MGLARGVQATIAVPLVHAGTGMLYGVAATVTVSKDGGAFGASTNSASSVADFGCAITLTATELTADVVTLKITDATVLPRVVTITTDAALVAANVTQISGDATAADNAEAFFDGTGYAGTNNTIPTVGTVTNPVTAGTVSDKTGYSLTAAYDAAKLAASQASVNAIPTTPLLAANYTAPDNASITAILEDTGTTLPAAIANLPTDADVQTAAGAALTAYGTAQTGDIPAADITAIKAKTDNLPAAPAAVGSEMTLTAAYDHAKDDVLTPLGVVDGIADAILEDTGTTLPASIANLPTDTDVSTAVWDAVSTEYGGPGTYGAALKALLFAALAGGFTWSYSGFVDETGVATVEIGDSYSIAHGRAGTWQVADADHALDLDTATSLTFKATDASWSCTATSTVDGYTIVCEVTALQTGALTAGTYDYELEALLADGDVVSLLHNTLVVEATV